MTRQQAIDRLVATRTLSTDMLKPLRIPFEHWLQWAQLDAAQAERGIERLIARLHGSKGKAAK